MAIYAVSNSTPLIYLAKIGKINFLKKIFDKVYIPVEVFDEVVTTGARLNKKEVFLLRKLIEEGFIVVKKPEKVLKGIETLHNGELMAISLSKELGIHTILIDDKEGYEFSRILRLRPMRTTALLLKFFKEGMIGYKEFSESILRLSEEGYFMRARVYSELIKRAKELKDRV